MERELELELKKELEQEARSPSEILSEAQKAASSLERVISGKKRPLVFRGEQYLEFEDWQTVAKFYGLCARTLEAEPVEIFGVKGAKAKAEVIDLRTGQVIGGAEAYCMRDEEKWKDKPWFQLASMAQTRAGAKALRNVLAWVVVLAGYRPTPAEEIQGESLQPAQGGNIKVGQGQSSQPAQSQGSLPIQEQVSQLAQRKSESSLGSEENVSHFPEVQTKSGACPEDTSNKEKTSLPQAQALAQEERPTKEEIQNLVNLLLKSGFSTVDSQGKKCLDYARLGEFLKENGFLKAIKEMSRKELQELVQLLQSRFPNQCKDQENSNS